MAFLTNAGALAARKRILAGRMEERFRHAAQLQATEMKRIAVELSSGTLTKKDLRDKGNPYAVRYPSGFAGMPDYIINQGAGDFAKSWRTRVQKAGNRWTVSIWNSSDHSKYLMGTVKTRKRNILMVVMQRTNPIFHKAVEKEIERGIAENSRASASVSANSAVSVSGGAIGSAPKGGYSGFTAYSVGIASGLVAAGSALNDAFEAD